MSKLVGMPVRSGKTADALHEQMDRSTEAKIPTSPIDDAQRVHKRERVVCECAHIHNPLVASIVTLRLNNGLACIIHVCLRFEFGI